MYGPLFIYNLSLFYPFLDSFYILNIFLQEEEEDYYVAIQDYHH